MQSRAKAVVCQMDGDFPDSCEAQLIVGQDDQSPVTIPTRCNFMSAADYQDKPGEQVPTETLPHQALDGCSECSEKTCGSMPGPGQPSKKTAISARGALIEQADLVPLSESWDGVPSEVRQAVSWLVFGLLQLRRGAEPSALVQNVSDAWLSSLGPSERGFLLMTAARSAEPDNLESLASAVLAVAGMPGVPFDSIRAEAKLWATEASPAELRAYCAAIWQRLTARDRATFLAAVSA